MRLLWLADTLRAAGLTVHEVAGWQTRSAGEDLDASTFVPRGVIIHETRSARIASDAAEINVLVNGRVGLSGPIAQLYLGRNGHWHVVAAGLCHHVRTGWGGPFTGLGNTRLLGVEPAHTVSVDSTGRRLETWAGKPVQYASYVRGVAAILRHTGWPAPVGHKEHQPGDKPDPEFDMGRFRADVARVLAGEEDDMTPEQAAQLADIHYLRQWLINGPPPEGAKVHGYPAPGSVGDVILRAATRPAAELSDAQVETIAARVAALLGPQLADAAAAAAEATVERATIVVPDQG